MHASFIERWMHTVGPLVSIRLISQGLMLSYAAVVDACKGVIVAKSEFVEPIDEESKALYTGGAP